MNLESRKAAENVTGPYHGDNMNFRRDVSEKFSTIKASRWKKFTLFYPKS